MPSALALLVCLAALALALVGPRLGADAAADARVGTADAGDGAAPVAPASPTPAVAARCPATPRSPMA